MQLQWLRIFFFLYFNFIFLGFLALGTELLIYSNLCVTQMPNISWLYFSIVLCRGLDFLFFFLIVMYFIWSVSFAGARSDWSMAVEPLGCSWCRHTLTLTRTVMELGRVDLVTATIHQVIFFWTLMLHCQCTACIKMQYKWHRRWKMYENPIKISWNISPFISLYRFISENPCKTTLCMLVKSELYILPWMSYQSSMSDTVIILTMIFFLSGHPTWHTRGGPERDPNSDPAGYCLLSPERKTQFHPHANRGQTCVI